jgi:secretion/DNA translocation related TadE-like protein
MTKRMKKPVNPTKNPPGVMRRWRHRMPALPARRRSGRPTVADRGSATVWTAVLTAALCAVFTAVLGMGQAVVVRHRAGGAADLAALAAADHALQGQRPACVLARRVAAAQGAQVTRCALTGEIADLTAEVRSGPFVSRVRSRAGPATGAALPDDSPGPDPADQRDHPAPGDQPARDQSAHPAPRPPPERS